MASKGRIAIFCGLVAILTFIVGILIGYFAISRASDEKDDSSRTQPFTDEKLDELLKTLNPESIEEFHKYFTELPHLAGTEQSNRIRRYIGEKFTEYGFDRVEYPTYNVLLSKLPTGESNVLELIDTDTNTVLVNVSGKEPIKDPGEDNPLVSPPFLGYSPNGTAEGELVYANYGRIEDFKNLTKSVSVNGRIVIMRFGKIFRGNKIKHAADLGAKGAILYNDPADYAPLGVNETYPKTWWLPGSAAQRGSIYMMGDGDPLTPGLPSVSGTFRIDENKAILPKIPAHTLNYDEAIKFLRVMSGPQAPESWRGSLPGIKYNLGPGFTTNTLKVKLQVKTQNTRDDIYNVIGTIIGSEEPDRYALLGNHHDAWIFGAVDPSSGTAIMMEIARGLGQLLKTGWRPRRTIKLCSWGGEEYALIGSYEWAEENTKLLSDRAVSYINMDPAVAGNSSFRTYGSYLLKDVIFDITKKVSDPNAFGDKKSVYDVWSVSKESLNGVPLFRQLGSGSDFAPMYQFIGIPSIDLGYNFYSEGVPLYPVYHTMHDSYHWMKTFVDPFYHYHLTIGSIACRLLLRSSDYPLLPFRFSLYGEKVVKAYEQLEKSHGGKLNSNGVTLTHLKDAVLKLNDAVKAFDDRVEKLDGWKANFAELRMLNDQMVQFERVFMEPGGLPGRPHIRHVLFAPSLHNLYGASSFAGVTDILFDIDKTNNWDELKKQLSFLTAAINAGARLLESF